MAPTMKHAVERAPGTKPCVLIVDDELPLRELLDDVLGGHSGECNIIAAGSIDEARAAIGAVEKVDLMLLDLNLPDGDGMSLLPTLRAKHPTAEAVVITGQASLDGVINAIRAGAIDFLPKPFTADHLRERVMRALARQKIAAKTDKRLRRLRRAVRRLNVSRRTVSKKVDLLCNDLVSAYGELSKQLDGVRVQESFRKLVDSAKDLEQLLCHAMDYVLRQAGYSNVAVWLAAEDGVAELGAYMKYTIPGDKEFTEAMKHGLLPLVAREGFVHLDPEEHAADLTPCECEYLTGQTLMAANCTYLGETLATFVCFRDARSPFKEEDATMLKAIAPIFATTLASVVRGEDGDDGDIGGDDDHDGDKDGDNGGDNGDNGGGDGGGDHDGDSPFYDGNTDANGDDGYPREDAPNSKKKPKKTNKKTRKQSDAEKERHSADWWKRGEPPPF